MLDFFLNKNWVILNENGEIEKTPSFPKDVTFLTDENGITKFYYDYTTCLVPIHPNKLIDNEQNSSIS